MVDFVDLAESSRWLLQRFLGDDNDDFVNLEGDGQQAAAAATAAHGGGDNILHTFVYEDSMNVQTRPFLSKSAEAELYLLCTNFLLYVAMVIITTMIAKIYFPESLERDASTPIPRNYSYRRQPMQNVGSQQTLDEDEALYSDDDEDDEEGTSGDGSNDRLGDFPPQHTPTHHSAHRDPLGLGATSPHGSVQDVEFDDEEADRLLLASQVTPRSRMTARVLEFDQETTSRAKVIQRLLFCSLMLNITFVTWGALQERMLTRRYPRHTGDYFTYSYALVFTNRFWTLIMSGLLLWYLKPRLSRSTVIYEFSFPSISNMLSSWCQYEALKYVSFPATTLFKSFKLAPVMLMGKLLGNKSCELTLHFTVVNILAMSSFLIIYLFCILQTLPTTTLLQWSLVSAWLCSCLPRTTCDSVSVKITWEMRK